MTSCLHSTGQECGHNSISDIFLMNGSIILQDLGKHTANVKITQMSGEVCRILCARADQADSTHESQKWTEIHVPNKNEGTKILKRQTC